MTDSDTILSRLISLIHRLQGESDGFLEHQDVAQLWYNRGYADGIVAAIRELGHGESLPSDLAQGPDPDLEQAIRAQALMPWGKAHAHGVEMGHKETFEVLGKR